MILVRSVVQTTTVAVFAASEEDAATEVGGRDDPPDDKWTTDRITSANIEKVSVHREEEWDVFPPGEWDNSDGPPDWYAVANNSGIVAYFGDEHLACEYQRVQRAKQSGGAS